MNDQLGCLLSGLKAGPAICDGEEKYRELFKENAPFSGCNFAEDKIFTAEGILPSTALGGKEPLVTFLHLQAVIPEQVLLWCLA